MKNQNLNLAKSTNYKLVIGAIPGVDLWLKTAMLPTISSNEVPIPKSNFRECIRAIKHYDLGATNGNIFSRRRSK